MCKFSSEIIKLLLAEFALRMQTEKENVDTNNPFWISCAIYLRAIWEKMTSWFASLTSEEIIQINFLGIYYLTVLVYTKTTVHLSVGG